MGGYGIEVTNDANEPFYRVELDSIERADHPTWSFRLNPNVMGNLPGRDKLDARGGTCKFLVDFVDDDGVVQRFDMGGNNAGFIWTISYSDSHGQRWRRTTDEDPVLIEADTA